MRCGVKIFEVEGFDQPAPVFAELAVLSFQCLDRHIPDKQILIDEIAALEHDRNAKPHQG
jgi:hypothetical protein